MDPATPTPGHHLVGGSSSSSNAYPVSDFKRTAADFKRVYTLLWETRRSFTVEQIYEACHVDLIGNKALFERLARHPNIKYNAKHGKHFTYKLLKHNDLRNQPQLVELIRSSEGVPVDDLKDTYPDAMQDMLALKALDHIWLIRNTDLQQVMAYQRYDPRVPPITVDDELKKLFRSIELPIGILEMKSAKRRNMAQNGDNIVTKKLKKIET